MTRKDTLVIQNTIKSLLTKKARFAELKGRNIAVVLVDDLADAWNQTLAPILYKDYIRKPRKKK